MIKKVDGRSKTGEVKANRFTLTKPVTFEDTGEGNGKKPKTIIENRMPILASSPKTITGINNGVILSIIALIIMSCSAYAADVSVQLLTSSTNTVIGENMPVKVKVLHGLDEHVESIGLPAYSNVIFSKPEYNKGEREDQIDIKMRFLDIGEVELPGFEILIGTRTIKSGTLKISVTGKIKDHSKELKKLRGQKGGNFPWWILILIIVIFALVYYFTRRKKIEDIKLKTQTPIEWYTSELAKIDRSAKISDVLDRLSDVFRIYLEKEYGFAAIYLNSGEIIKAMKTMDFSSDEKMRVAAFLRSCDLAKFAKKEFEEGEINKLFDEAYSFAKREKTEKIVERG